MHKALYVVLDSGYWIYSTKLYLFAIYMEIYGGSDCLKCMSTYKQPESISAKYKKQKGLC